MLGGIRYSVHATIHPAVGIEPDWFSNSRCIFMLYFVRCHTDILIKPYEPGGGSHRVGTPEVCWTSLFSSCEHSSARGIIPRLVFHHVETKLVPTTLNNGCI